MSTLHDRVSRVDRGRVDTVFAVVMIAELQLESWLGGGMADSRRVLTAVAALLFAAPIAFRRRWPGGALVFCAAVTVIQALLGANLINDLTGAVLPPVVLGYGAGAWLDSRRALRVVLLAVGLFGVAMLLSDEIIKTPGHFNLAGDLFFVSLLVATPWFVGRLARDRSQRAAAFSELAVQAATERVEGERAAITQERVRIGGELQDIIAHSLSAMVIQAGGARRVLRSDPERARDSILTVEQTGREALADLRRLLGMLRKDDDPRALAPQPGLGQLAALVGSMRDHSVACELREEGEPIALTPGIDLVGYRVIEATLLSAAHHHSRRAVVTVRYRPERLELEIRGDGAMPDFDGELGGLSERVALYDGSLRALPAGADEFALQARLPLGTAVPV